MMNKALVAQIRDALEDGKRFPLTEMAKARQATIENALRCLAALEEAEQCNGWSNWETWNVKLWLDNEQATSTAARWLVEDNGMEDGTAAEALKDYCEGICFGDERGELNSGMAADLIKGALGAVNWQEIARAYAAELAEG